MSAHLDPMAVLVADTYDMHEVMASGIRLQVARAREWHKRLMLAIRGDEAAECHPESARWQRRAYMSRARRIRSELAALAAFGGAA